MLMLVGGKKSLGTRSTYLAGIAGAFGKSLENVLKSE
jgi:hypothetical protein